MRSKLFSFELPQHLIAQTPMPERDSSRLMVLDRSGYHGAVEHCVVSQLPELLKPGTLMVFNDTKVRQSRMFAINAETGGRGEFLFLHLRSDGDWECIVDKAKRKRIGQKWVFPADITGRITGSPAEDMRTIRLEHVVDEEWFETHGHIPLPPYMRRPDNAADAERYQTVYAHRVGSAAAPTAGLHFTTRLMEELKERKIEIAWLTLQVGLGTFAPVRTEFIADHPMHHEKYSIPMATCQAVESARREGRPILAVGTTTVRSLESAWDGQRLQQGNNTTDLFISPGYRFQIVDAVFTNFHTPESTLLMMISAFAGRERILDAYKIAIEQEYRFFSYGDAMLIR